MISSNFPEIEKGSESCPSYFDLNRTIREQLFDEVERYAKTLINPKIEIVYDETIKNYKIIIYGQTI